MVGDSSCGKTSLVLRFDHDVFSSKFVTTIGVDYRDKLVKIDGASVRLQLWDTAGQERFRSLTNNFFGRADGFVLSYDVSNRTSFEHVQSWMQDINTRAPPDVDIVLCGNKCDLGEDERKVSIQEGAALADEYGVAFFETSAKTGAAVHDMFLALGKSIKQRRVPDPGGGIELESPRGGGGRGAGEEERDRAAERRAKQSRDTFKLDDESVFSRRRGADGGVGGLEKTFGNCCG
ncbi:hypothetical protein TeGR_g5284 [Tetraparma gracilis]|uniref:Uncharacterized protein n=1 Tax=Tetraparma gracilis TaxID=2962635 RepID=A0ABQ6MZW7_9STRA|nr:hypothetical protein TeGR_g5284 [Tetraparma gracilis]